MQVCRLDSRRSSELKNPWVCNLSQTWTKSSNESWCQRVRTVMNKVKRGQQGFPYMWAHGSWLSGCPTTSHVPVKLEVSTGNGYRLLEVDRKSFNNVKCPEHKVLKYFQLVCLEPNFLHSIWHTHDARFTPIHHMILTVTDKPHTSQRRSCVCSAVKELALSKEISTTFHVTKYHFIQFFKYTGSTKSCWHDN